MKHTSSQNSREASQGRGEQVPTLSTSRPQYDLIKLGVDTHAGQYTLARMIDQAGIQPPQRLSPEAFIGFLKEQLKLAAAVVMVYEAGPYGYALQRQASELGVRCLVCAPERMSRGRRRVNDKIDAKELCSRLDRHLAGNSAALRLVRVPSVEQELARRAGRERNMYRKERQRWISRGRSLLHLLGIARPGRWWELDRRQQLLKRIQDEHGQQVMEQVRSELDRHLEMVQTMQIKLEQRTKELIHPAKPKVQQQSKSAKLSVSDPQAQKEAAPVKMRIKGIGPLSEQLLEREIMDWSRFANRRQVASYTGLCPGEDSSGDQQMSLSIDKHGNPRIRALLVELAWLLPRYQPDYLRLKRWKQVFDKPGRAMRKKAAVALARQLAVDLWRIKTGRARPQDLGLKLVA
jgi:transposase